jgi:hypothetical protein
LKRINGRIAKLHRRVEKLEGVSNHCWTARRVILVCGVCGVLLVLFLGKYRGVVGWVLAASSVVTFWAVALYHRRIRDSITRHSLMLDIKHMQLARIHLDWDRLPPAEQSVAKVRHPFEIDLDITGEKSLHRLLDSAITKGGSQRLRSWLLNTTPDPLIIKRRQAIVQDLQKRSLFRDKLQLHSVIAGGSSKGQWDSSVLINWIEHRAGSGGLRRSTVILLGSLAGLNILLFLLANLNWIPHVWPVVLIIYVGVMVTKQARISTAWGEVRQLAEALRRFRSVFQYLESGRWKNTPGLAEICAPFLDKRNRPSSRLRRLEWLASALGVRTNAFLWLGIHAFVPWDFFFTYRLELLKKDVAHLLPVWLDNWYEIEALNSLANFAYLNPRYTFPEIASDWSVFSARALGHPLIKPENKICNDFEIKQDRRIVILTGSNMAGKSTFARTVGVSLCLAYAGAPVNADRLEVSLFRVFTCIKVSDSVQDGLSYFYAEVKQLKALLSATEAKDLPVFFLIDEIFRGTNNRERHVGSRSFIRGLSNTTAVGIIATHDLELVKLADDIPVIANFHFSDEVREGRMVFDYMLRPGQCTTTNALRIMRGEGLPVDLDLDLDPAS